MPKNYFPVLKMTMVCEAGVLTGAVSLRSYLVPYIAGAAKDMTRYRVAVFVDGIIIAETDNITEERHSFALPYSITVPTKTVTIEARIKVMQGITVAYDAFKVVGGQLWARNGKA
jgi:hypothetical protein